ncbi:hypothetical protein FM038_003490 [Shewanella eurypsychrophilus]|uniref:PBP domain-containing protein n=1 Tax=Shewanella eurypsychrophilus TaxID=2593656 RepID=A0ABX6V3P1_9GAMM|nr:MULTISPECIES: hypothetical protein [Shewanella]QFU21302.1 hypothetical protein FS418_05070 [Shewanella sp. YLB-09]QPG56593.1 hypothetical protein FM038_003490 [Shewanella eurypsychrophilus]
MRLLATWMLVLYLFCAHSTAAQVIVNDSAIDFPLPAQELRLIFSMQKVYWPDGQKIQVYILSPNSDLHKEFCVQQLDMMPYMLQRRWDRLVYSGTGERPIILRSEAEMHQVVSATPGSIGYITEQSVVDDNNVARSAYETTQ